MGDIWKKVIPEPPEVVPPEDTWTHLRGNIWINGKGQMANRQPDPCPLCGWISFNRACWSCVSRKV